MGGGKIQRDMMQSSYNVDVQDAYDTPTPQNKSYVIKKFGESSIYVGQLNEGTDRHGYGIMKYTNGRQYEGTWENDLRVGEGYERYHNGNTYSGNFKAGKADGHGVYTWLNGEVYDGEWVRGNK